MKATVTGPSIGARSATARRGAGRLGSVAALAALGLLALGTVPAPASPIACVPNNGSDTVSIIDTATNGVVATVPVGRGPWGVAVHPAGTFCYVASYFSDTVSVVDIAASTVVATVPVPGPVTVAAHPAGTIVYVSDEGGTVHVVDTGTNTVTGTITTPWGMDGSPGLAVHPAGTFLYVANTLAETVSVVDTAINAVVADVPVGSRPWGVAVHPTGASVYVTTSRGVSVIDTVGRTVVAAVEVDGIPAGVAAHPAGTFVYVTQVGMGTVAVLETATNTVVASVPVGAGPAGVAVHPAGTFLYVANQRSDTVSVLATASNTVVATVAVGEGPVAYGQFVGPTRSGHFGDVPRSHPFWAWIEALFEAGITGGCHLDPPLYCPDREVTREQMAVFLVRAIHGPGFDPPAATGTVFADVPAGHPFARWIEQLARDGVTGGCTGSPPAYCPTAHVTRAQMAVFLARAVHGAGFEPPAATGMAFADVPAGHPFARWIEQLARDGITGGCGRPRYCPDATVTRGQMAVYLVRAFDLSM